MTNSPLCAAGREAHACSRGLSRDLGEDLVIGRGPTPIAHVTRIDGGQEHAGLCATLRRERAKQQAVTTSEILSRRHEGHTR